MTMGRPGDECVCVERAYEGERRRDMKGMEKCDFRRLVMIAGFDLAAQQCDNYQRDENGQFDCEGAIGWSC